MSDVMRVSSSEIRPRVLSGDALLVCAYESDEKFKAYHLEGAVSFTEFQDMAPKLAKNKELVFFCA
ncbi:MAG: hypothetical protein WBB19_12075 [Desulforhopalus sp.]